MLEFTITGFTCIRCEQNANDHGWNIPPVIMQEIKTEKLLQVQTVNPWSPPPANTNCGFQAHTLKPSLHQAIILCVHVCACVWVCVCVCVSWGWGWTLGRMELRVGSNIMILFLYMLLLLIWHMYFLCACILYSVSCHNYMYYVCNT